MKNIFSFVLLPLLLLACASSNPRGLTYPIVGTGQSKCYDDAGEMSPPAPGQPYYGQDAQHRRNPPSYRDNGDGTVSDLVTGLMWVKARGSKVAWEDAVSGASSSRVGGHADWRAPTIKELYSLIDFSGGFHPEGGSKPYIDTRYFGFEYGDVSLGERPIDCQDWSATEYVGTTMMRDTTVFGVNFGDGRIKGYPKYFPGPPPKRPNRLYIRYVRGNPRYGVNDFVDNGDGTVTDRATGLMWAKADSGLGMNWVDALSWVQERNGENYLGHGDWRLPSAKELQSIVDYTRAPSVTGTAAIDSIFSVTAVESYFWTGTTHLDGPAEMSGRAAVYIAFGRAMGWMQMPPGSGVRRLIDVHGAGAQRSDPKSGDPADYPYGRGPQGDDIRILNYVRCVRDAG